MNEKLRAELVIKARENGALHGKTAELDFGAGAEWMYEQIKPSTPPLYEEVDCPECGGDGIEDVDTPVSRVLDACGCCEGTGKIRKPTVEESVEYDRCFPPNKYVEESEK